MDGRDDRERLADGLGIPFRFPSGYGEALPSGAEGTAAPVVLKPDERNQLAAVITHVIKPR
jgi:hypothetical protein